MWRLDEFRFDDGIDAREVYLFDEATRQLEPMSREDAIAVARSLGANLIASWPVGSENDAPSCVIGRVTLPLRWERLPEEDALGLDGSPLVRGSVRRS